MANFKKRQKNKGFTLIELLVVIAIIALLAVIVMASLNTARDKAQNTKRNEMAIQYVNALALYRDGNTSYPNTGNDDYICIGAEWDGDGCVSGVEGVSNVVLNGALKTFISGPPTNNHPLNANNADWSGTAYRCTDALVCDNYELEWYVKGNFRCSIDAQRDETLLLELGIVKCTYSSLN